MSKMEDAARRLEAAVVRLERTLERRGERGIDGAAESRQLVADLAAARENYAALEATTTRVATRLDATIERLNAALGAT
jgi:cell division protein FtsB